MCWLWKAVALAQVSDLREGSLHVLYEKLLDFQLIVLSCCETQGWQMDLAVTNFSQANGTADGSF